MEVTTRSGVIGVQSAKLSLCSDEWCMVTRERGLAPLMSQMERRTSLLLDQLSAPRVRVSPASDYGGGLSVRVETDCQRLGCELVLLRTTVRGGLSAICYTDSALICGILCRSLSFVVIVIGDT